MVKLIGISYGHNDKYNKGASGFRYEDLLNAEVGQLVIDTINNEGVFKAIRLYKADVTSYEDSINYRPLMANKLGCHLIIDIHHNSYNDPKANGSEILACSEEGEYCGLEIVKEMHRLGYTNRGAKYNNYAFNRLSKMTSLIFEGFFVSNKEDCNRYDAAKEANAIVQGIYNYYKVKRSSGNVGREYVVIPGDTLYSIAMKVGTTVNDLVEQNKIKDKNLIFVGQKLFY